MQHSFYPFMKNMKILLIAVLVAFAACEELRASPPLLPEQFTAKFEEASILIVTGITEGWWHYDSKAQKEEIFRFNGRYDRYCGSIFRGQETSCRHIVTGGTALSIQAKDISTSPKGKFAASAATAARDAE